MDVFVLKIIFSVFSQLILLQRQLDKTRNDQRLFLSNLLINWVFLNVLFNDLLQTGFSFTEQRFGRYKSFYVSFIDY